jgi:hypothetical protein
MGRQRRKLSLAEAAGPRRTDPAGRARDTRQRGSAGPARQAVGPPRLPPRPSSEASARPRREADRAGGRASGAPGATLPQAPRPAPAWGTPDPATTGTPPPATRRPQRPGHAATTRSPSGLAGAHGQTPAAAWPSSPLRSSARHPGTARTSMPDRLSSSRLSGNDNPLDVIRQAIAYTLAERRDTLQRDGRAAQRSTVTKMNPRRPELPATAPCRAGLPPARHQPQRRISSGEGR